MRDKLLESFVTETLEEILQDLSDEGEDEETIWNFFDYEYEASEEKLLSLLELEKQKNPNVNFFKKEFPSGKTFYVLKVKDKTILFPGDENKMFSIEKDPIQFIHDAEWSDYYPDFDEKFNQEFWDSPVPLLHGTTDIESVLQTGLEARSDSRGLTNKGVGLAVFATTDESVAKEYGSDGIVVINTLAMKQAGFTPFVSQEPDILDAEIKDAIAHAFRIIDFHYDYMDSGMHPDTIIIYDSIPPKFLSRYQG